MKLVLSSAADKDLQSIFDYTYLNFGSPQAFKYVSSFDTCFDLIRANPNVGRDRSAIREGLRSLVFKKHIVFYRRSETVIRVVRILHGSQDLPTQFDKP